MTQKWQRGGKVIATLFSLLLFCPSILPVEADWPPFCSVRDTCACDSPWLLLCNTVEVLRQVTDTGCNATVMTVISKRYQWWAHQAADRLGR